MFTCNLGPPAGCGAGMGTDMVQRAQKSKRASVAFNPLFTAMPPWFAYLAGLLAVLAATLLRYALDPWLNDRGPFATFFPAVAVAVFFGRLPAGLCSIFLATIAADYLFFSPRHSFGIQGSMQATELIAFMVG